jgi:hypothetical protein
MGVPPPTRHPRGRTLLYATVRFDCCGVLSVEPASPHATVAWVATCPECGAERVVPPASRGD